MGAPPLCRARPKCALYKGIGRSVTLPSSISAQVCPSPSGCPAWEVGSPRHIRAQRQCPGVTPRAPFEPHIGHGQGTTNRR